MTAATGEMNGAGEAHMHASRRSLKIKKGSGSLGDRHHYHRATGRI